MKPMGRIVFACLAALPLLAMGAAQAAEPLKLRIGWVVVPASLEPIMFAKEGIAVHNGKSYILEPIHFAGTTQQLQALGTGDLDLANLAYSAIGVAIQNANMQDLRVIFDGVQDGAHGYYSNEFMVLKDSPIQKIEDLKGKVLATNAIGTAVDIGMKALARRHGLEDKRDFSVVEIGFPNMKSVLLEHKADIATFVPPFAYDPELRDKARTLFTMHDAMGTTQLTALTARTGFIKQHRAAVVDYLEDAIRAIHWYTDPKNHDEAVKIVADFMKRPPALFEKWLFTKGDDYRDPNGMPDLAALRRNLDTEVQLGLLKQKIDVNKYADLSMVKAAGQRMK